MKSTEVVSLIALLIVGMVCSASAQIRLGYGVFGTGGGMLSNSTYAAAGTIGQPVIGRSVGTTFAASAGFWGDGGLILDVEGPLPAGTPAEFALRQNFPNPFNPSTIIGYDLPARSRVLMTVFNTLGQHVAALQNGEQEAGYHEVKFDASGLPSGMYFYRLQAGDYVATKKLLLLR